MTNTKRMPRNAGGERSGAERQGLVRYSLANDHSMETSFGRLRAHRRTPAAIGTRNDREHLQSRTTRLGLSALPKRHGALINAQLSRKLRLSHAKAVSQVFDVELGFHGRNL